MALKVSATDGNFISRHRSEHWCVLKNLQIERAMVYVRIGDPVEHVCVHLGDHRQFRVLEDRLGRHGSLCEFRHKGTATAILLHLPHVVLRAPQDRQEHGTGMRAMCGEGGKFRSGAHQGWRHSRPFSCILAERDVVE